MDTKEQGMVEHGKAALYVDAVKYSYASRLH